MRRRAVAFSPLALRVCPPSRSRRLPTAADVGRCRSALSPSPGLRPPSGPAAGSAVAPAVTAVAIRSPRSPRRSGRPVAPTQPAGSRDSTGAGAPRAKRRCDPEVRRAASLRRTAARRPARCSGAPRVGAPARTRHVRRGGGRRRPHLARRGPCVRLAAHQCGSRARSRARRRAPRCRPVRARPPDRSGAGAAARWRRDRDSSEPAARARACARLRSRPPTAAPAP